MAYDDTNESKKPNAILFFLLQIITLGLCVIFFLPLFVNHNMLFPYVFPKTMLFRLIIEFCFILYILCIAKDSKLLPKPSFIFLSLALFVSMIFLSGIFGIDSYHSFFSSIERSEGIITWIHLLGFFVLLAGTIRTKKDWNRLFIMIIASGWLQTLYATSQLLNLPFAIKSSGDRIHGSIGNASFFAAYAIFIIGIAAYRYLMTNTKIAKFQYGILIGLNCVLIWFSQTRGAILALFVGILAITIIFLIGKHSKKIKIVSICIIVLFAISALFVYANKNTGWIMQSPTLNKLSAISSSDISSNNRLIVWNSGWRGFLQKPILGWGWENFNAVFNANYNPAIARDVGSQPWYDRAHNIVIEILSTAGLAGIIAYALIFLSAIASILAIRKKNKKQGSVLGVFIILFITYFIQNLFVFDTLSTYILFIFILAYIHFEKKSLADDAPENESKKNSLLGTTFSVFGIIVCLASMFFFVIRPTLGNRYTVIAVTKNKTNILGMLENFKKSFTFSPANDQELRYILIQYSRDQLTLRNADPSVQPLIHYAIQEMEKSIRTAPHMLQNSLVLAELYISANIYDANFTERAEQLMLDALRFGSKRYQIHSMLGRIKISRGKFDEGIQYFKNAVQFNDNFAEAHWNLAIAYILTNRPEMARESLQKAYEKKFDIYAQANIIKVLNAYKDSKNLLATIQYLKEISERFPQDPLYTTTLRDLEKIYLDMNNATTTEIK